MMRAIVVDDEQPARERLERLLIESGRVRVIGQAADGPSAMALVQDVRPDVAFLDIQMPGATGLDVAASLEAPRPAIVFCTAFEEFAVDAFELHSVDYLLKPVNRARLERTLSRLESPAAGRDRAVDAAVAGAPRRFLGKRGNRYFVVPREHVLYFVSEDGQTAVVTREGRYWMQPALADLEARLDGRDFCRVSRSAIVALDAVRSVTTHEGGSGELVLHDGGRVPVSRRRLQAVLAQLSRS